MSDIFGMSTPGPNHYDQNARATWRAAPAYTLKGRSQTLRSYSSPAPNTYNPQSRHVFRRPPSFTMKGRIDATSERATTAPNQYTPCLQRSQSTITMSSRYPKTGTFNWDLEHNKSVGPAQYTRTSAKMAGRFSMKSRHPESCFGSKSLGPGPAGYDKAKASGFVRKAAPKYSLKARPADPKKGTMPAPNAYTCKSPWKNTGQAFTLKDRPHYRGINHGSIEFRYKMFLLQ